MTNFDEAADLNVKRHIADFPELRISSGYPKENHAQWISKSGANVTLFDKAKFVALIFVLHKYAV